MFNKKLNSHLIMKTYTMFRKIISDRIPQTCTCHSSVDDTHIDNFLLNGLFRFCIQAGFCNAEVIL